MSELKLMVAIPVPSPAGYKVTFSAAGPLGSHVPDAERENERFLRALAKGLIEAGYHVEITRTVTTTEQLAP